MADWVLTKPLWLCAVIHLSVIEHYLEAVVQRHFVKKMFLEISQNLQENTCATEHLWWLLLATAGSERVQDSQ